MRRQVASRFVRVVDASSLRVSQKTLIVRILISVYCLRSGREVRALYSWTVPLKKDLWDFMGLFGIDHTKNAVVVYPKNPQDPKDPFLKAVHLDSRAEPSSRANAGAQKIRTGCSRTILSPFLHPNAAANSAMFDNGPFTRNSPGECGSVCTARRSA